jgi:hypothetical protein
MLMNAPFLTHIVRADDSGRSYVGMMEMKTGSERPENGQLSNFGPRRNFKINHMYSKINFH